MVAEITLLFENMLEDIKLKSFLWKEKQIKTVLSIEVFFSQIYLVI